MPKTIENRQSEFTFPDVEQVMEEVNQGNFLFGYQINRGEQVVQLVLLRVESMDLDVVLDIVEGRMYLTYNNKTSSENLHRIFNCSYPTLVDLNIMAERLIYGTMKRFYSGPDRDRFLNALNFHFHGYPKLADDKLFNKLIEVKPTFLDRPRNLRIEPSYAVLVKFMEKNDRFYRFVLVKGQGDVGIESEAMHVRGAECITSSINLDRKPIQIRYFSSGGDVDIQYTNETVRIGVMPVPPRYFDELQHFARPDLDGDYQMLPRDMLERKLVGAKKIIF